MVRLFGDHEGLIVIGNRVMVPMAVTATARLVDIGRTSPAVVAEPKWTR